MTGSLLPDEIESEMLLGRSMCGFGIARGGVDAGVTFATVKQEDQR